MSVQAQAGLAAGCACRWGMSWLQEFKAKTHREQRHAAAHPPSPRSARNKGHSAHREKETASLPLCTERSLGMKTHLLALLPFAKRGENVLGAEFEPAEPGCSGRVGHSTARQPHHTSARGVCQHDGAVTPTAVTGAHCLCCSR